MKRIVLCFDGTWNTPADDAIPEEERVETNVRRFFQSVPLTAADGTVQDPWYNEGVGTGRLNRELGGAFGVGLDQHIVDGYRHLVDTYEDGDEVYVLGFSRGAYTARSLVGMIRNCGLVRPKFAALRVPMAFGIYRTRQDGPDSSVARGFRSAFGREIRVRFLGLWDTVGALGIPGPFLDRVDAALYQFHDTRLSSIVDRAYHALALDEHRSDYAATLWDEAAAPGQVFEQRWFAGAHSDVGGGYPDRRLSDLSLRWMQDRAAEAGLELKPVGVRPDGFAGPPTDSYALFLGGKFARLVPRHFRPVFATTAGNEVLDPSVERRRGDAGLAYRPGNPGLPAAVV
ncbi:MAG TPA: DUF2235 domain-containing protein [Urbifossiella sp.]|nr:DUF2235 domain-containing protein [Urbifossiella sp.]